MSSIDRLANLAKGVISDGQKRFDAGGGLSGAARRASTKARAAAESARTAVEEGWSGLTDVSTDDADPLVDPALAAARSEVDDLRAASSIQERASSPAPAATDGLSAELAALDAQLRAGDLNRAQWEDARTRLLDAHDRASTDRSPRRRTL